MGGWKGGLGVIYRAGRHRGVAYLGVHAAAAGAAGTVFETSHEVVQGQEIEGPGGRVHTLRG